MQKKLLFVISEHTVLNYSDFLSHLFMGLTEAGCRCAVVVPHGLAYDFCLRLPVEVVRYPYIKTVFFKKYNFEKICEFVSDFSPISIHCLSERKLGLVNAISKRFRLPYIVSYLQEPNVIFKKRVLSDHCFKLLAANNYITKELEHRHPFLKNRLERAPFGTFIDTTIACFSDYSMIPSIVVTHSFKNVNEFHTLLSAVRHLGIDGYEFMIAIVGQGRAEMALRKIVQNMGLSHLINIVSNVNPIRKFLAGADIYLQPWPMREFNSILYEAIGVGLAVVLPNEDKDMLDDGQAVFFDHDDELSLYSALKKLLDQKDRARELAKRAQYGLREKISASNMVMEYERIYDKSSEWLKQDSVTV